MRRAVPILALVVGCIGLAIPRPVAAHPFGPFSISVYSGLTVHPDRIDIRWVMDMAQSAAVATVELIDEDGNGLVSEEEKEAYFSLWVGSVVDGITLVVDGTELSKTVVDRGLDLPADEGGSPALRLVMNLTAQLPAGQAAHAATYQDTNYTEYPGWREVAVAPATGVRLLDSSAPMQGRTQELTVYPPDLGASVPTSHASFTFTSDTSRDVPPAVSDGSQASAGEASGFTLWPTGILAAVLVLGLIALLIAVNRPGNQQTVRRRR